MNDGIMQIEVSGELLRFIRKMVVDTKYQIVANQGGILGHPRFDKNADITIKRKGHDVAMIHSGKMVATITCDVEFTGNDFNITITSPQEYSSFAQKANRNWNFLDITQEELEYYKNKIIQSIMIR